MRKSLYGLTVALITLPSTSALAGHYQAGPSIGLAITAVPPPPGTTSGPFVGSGTCSAGAGGGNGAAGVSGTISTTLSWVRDLDANGQPILSDVPPEKVAIWETCSVQSMGICYPGSPSATAQNGLDSRFSINVTSTVPQYVTLPFPPFQIQIGTMVESRSIGTAPRIVAGAESIQVTCSPTGSAAAANGPVSVAVDYSVWAEPVTLSVDNLTNQSECLIGQGHEGSLACPGLTLVGHSWILPDQVFKDFVVAADKTSATLFEIEFSDLTDASPHWYWNTPGSKIVRCSANASYNGISLGTVSAKKLVDVW